MWQEPSWQGPSSGEPLEAVHLPNGSFATWRTRMGRTATQRVTEGAFEIRRPLDGLNFFLADVRDGLGPYLAIWLLTTQRWDEARIGIVMTVMGIATVAAQTPAGAFIDWTRFKRGMVVAAAVLVAAACVTITLAPVFPVVAACKAAMGVGAALFPPAVAAITLGLAGPRA